MVATTPGIAHHVALPRRAGVAGRSGALADTRAADRLIADGATVHVVDMRRNPLHPANAAAVAAVGRLIREIEPDVVHGHSSVGGLVARVAARPAAVPAVHTPNGLMTSPPAVALERVLGTATARVIAVSGSEAGRVASHRLVPAERIVVIPNGISLASPGPAPDVRARLGLPAGTPLVATVARVARQKAPQEFVRACAAIARRRPAVHFLLVGLGPHQRLVDHEVRAARLGGRFHQIPHLDDAAAAMGQFDLFLLLSRYEGGPYVPLEAMWAGVPVVLSDVVGNRDTVVDTVTGYLTPFGDAEAAAAAAIGLLDDPDRRAAVVAAARARVRAEFDRQTMGRRLAALYRELAVGDRQAPTRRRTRRLPHASAGQSAKRPDDRASQ